MNLSEEGWRYVGRQLPSEAVISVCPVAGGWCVSSPIEENLMFLAGDDAEDQARTLGGCLASLGQAAIVEVFNREGDLAGFLIYPAGSQGGAS